MLRMHSHNVNLLIGIERLVLSWTRAPLFAVLLVLKDNLISPLPPARPYPAHPTDFPSSLVYAPEGPNIYLGGHRRLGQ